MKPVPVIRTIEALKLIGIRQRMSFANDQTRELWNAFMPRRKEIKNALSTDLYSLQEYGPGFDFGPFTKFEKWALLPVRDWDELPEGMQSYYLERGQYAVFHYKGKAGEAGIFDYIFREWLPSSGYQLDNRPHFEILKEGYDPGDPESEEEICIPIRN